MVPAGLYIFRLCEFTQKEHVFCTAFSSKTTEHVNYLDVLHTWDNVAGKQHLYMQVFTCVPCKLFYLRIFSVIAIYE